MGCEMSTEELEYRLANKEKDEKENAIGAVK